MKGVYALAPNKVLIAYPGPVGVTGNIDRSHPRPGVQSAHVWCTSIKGLMVFARRCVEHPTA